MFDKLLWPITFGLMCFLVTSKGGTGTELLINTSVGVAVGAVFSLAIIKVIRRPQTRLIANSVIAVLWGIILLSIGYPNLYVPGQQLSTAPVAYLVMLSSAPLVAIAVAVLVNRMRQAKQ